MRILFIDESGDPGRLPDGDRGAQPALAVLGLALKQSEIQAMTRQWIELKRRFFPGLCRPSAATWDWQTAEIKGTDLRRAALSTVRRERRGAIGFIDRALDLLERFDARLCARVWIKPPGQAFNGRAVYAFSIQDICRQFQAALDMIDEPGLVIADSRTQAPNVNVAHSVFTQKFSAMGDPYPRILEVPCFGHSDNHAGLQLADLLVSTLLTPICCGFFLAGRLDNRHAAADYAHLADRYVGRLHTMFMRHPTDPQWRACVISDPVGFRGVQHLLQAFPGRGVSAGQPASG